VLRIGKRKGQEGQGACYRVRKRSGTDYCGV
jgi:hypothetical protein